MFEVNLLNCSVQNYQVTRIYALNNQLHRYLHVYIIIIIIILILARYNPTETEK